MLHILENYLANTSKLYFKIMIMIFLIIKNAPPNNQMVIEEHWVR